MGRERSASAEAGPALARGNAQQNREQREKESAQVTGRLTWMHNVASAMTQDYAFSGRPDCGIRGGLRHAQTRLCPDDSPAAGVSRHLALRAGQCIGGRVFLWPAEKALAPRSAAAPVRSYELTYCDCIFAHTATKGLVAARLGHETDRSLTIVTAARPGPQ